MPTGGRSSSATPRPTPSTRSFVRSRRRGPTKTGTKDTAYRRSAIPTRVGSSIRRYWPNKDEEERCRTVRSSKRPSSTPLDCTETSTVKGTRIPYVTHLLAVAATVGENGGGSYVGGSRTAPTRKPWLQRSNELWRRRRGRSRPRQDRYGRRVPARSMRRAGARRCRS